MRRFLHQQRVSLEGSYRQLSHPLNKWIPTMLALLFIFEVVPTAKAQSTFVLDEPLHFNYAGTNQRQLAFRVSSSKDDIPDVRVVLRSLKDPDGQSLPQNALTLCVDNKDCNSGKPVTITEAGSEIVLTLQPESFQRVGEYHAFIDIVPPASSSVNKASANVLITRPAAEINVDDIKDQTIQVFRSYPGASGERTFSLYLLSSKAPIDNVRASGQGVFVKDTKILGPGELVIDPAQPSGSNTTTPANGGTDPAAIRLNVNAKNLTRAGYFDTSVVIDSPSLAERKVIPLHINVSDIVVWPLLVILLGVFAAFFVNQLSGKWRTRQLNRRTILRLQSELSRFRQVVKSPENAARVDAMWRGLRGVEDANELDDQSKVTAELEKIENDLTEFRKMFVEAKAQNQTDLSNLRHDIDLFQQQFKHLTPDDERNLHSLQDRLDDAKRLLNDDQVDYASEKITSIKVLFADLRKALLTRYFEDLQKSYNEVKVSSNATDPASEALISTISGLLDEGKLEEAGKQLEELKLTIEQFTDAKKAPAGRGTAPTELESPPVLTRAERTRIAINTPPRDRTTDNTINFEIIDSENLVQADDVLRWNFGEPGSQQEAGAKNSYKYREFGNYYVKVDILRGGNTIRSLEEPLTILPGANVVQSRQILRNIKRGDLLLSLIALVLAGLTGLLALYIGQAFGTLSDYVVAFLWGFGIDNSVRGFAAVMSKLSSSGGAG
jgi:hypothetical protein